MNPQLFIYRISHLNKDNHLTYCGIAFPITDKGDFLTCYHVLNQKMEQGDRMVIYDNERQMFQTIEDNVIHDAPRDVSILLNPLRRPKNEFFPLLDPKDILTGEDVYTYGYYKNMWNKGNIDNGYFKGNVVNILPNSLAGGEICLTTSFAIIEGLSGSPLMTYHNGIKLVGLNLGNNQHRVQQSVVSEYKDEKNHFQETTSRIVEFGISLHPTPIVDSLTKNGVQGYNVTSQELKINGL